VVDELSEVGVAGGNVPVVAGLADVDHRGGELAQALLVDVERFEVGNIWPKRPNP
jgi:hypothetical protein